MCRRISSALLICLAAMVSRLPFAAAQLATTTPSQVASAAAAVAKQFAVPAKQQWTDTGIDLNAGDKVTITSSGEIKFLGTRIAGPDGLARGWADLIRALPVNEAGNGALVGRVSDNAAAVPFVVGASKEFLVRNSGRLFLGINQLAKETSDGEYDVKVTVNSAPAQKAAEIKTPKFDGEILAKIPRRIADQQNNPGDMVNFMIVGPEDKMKAAFADGGWVLVDRTPQEAVLTAALASLQHKSYLEMPMSELYLFGRPQDFGFARAEPIQVAAARHHLRVWRAPFDVDGQPLWVGAATHDIGFERDNRNNGVTHKIDPNIDEEREFVGTSLDHGGNVAKLDYVTPNDAVKEAHTATGGSWHSDGRVLVMVLR